MVAFELAVQDTYGLAVASRLGPDRVELCSALPLGGLTPSLALVEAAVGTPGIPPVHVLIRPRPGGFDYEPGEVTLMVRDAGLAVAAGAAGVVIGGVRAGQVDLDLIARIKDATGTDVQVTFHRAFDILDDPGEALGTLVKLGVTRVLTSGGAASAGDALPELARLVQAAAGRIEIMAGGGVRPEMVPSLVATGVAAVHASGKRTVAEKTRVTLGSAAPSGQNGRETTDEREVGRLLAALRAARGR